MKENTWIKISNYQNKNLNFKGDHFFGYTYIDHEAGLTVDAIKFFKIENNSIVITEDCIELNERTIFRFEALSQKYEMQLSKRFNSISLLYRTISQFMTNPI